MIELSYLQQNYEVLANAFAQNPSSFAIGFFAVYVLVTALSLPLATLLTLLAGALFGFLPGMLLVSFASAMGATAAMLIARFVFSRLILQRFGSYLETINQGIEKDGAFYLFALRLTPVAPFFIVNLLMGLTKIHAFTFYWVSQLGMLALSAVYVNAGTQLKTLTSLSGIASPMLLGSLALAGIAPLLLKKWMAWMMAVRAKANIYKPWQEARPTSFDRNLIVIGGGAGGLVSAYIAAVVKAKVTLIEAHKMGGDCLNYGCVPSKALIKSAKVAHQMKHASKYGLQDANTTFSFRVVMARVHAVITAIEPHDSVERYTGLGVEVLQGYAKIINPWTVEVALNDGGNQLLTARSIVIATGASPFVPPLAGIENSGYLTSDTLWDAFAKLDEIPKRIVVLGGGPIGCELAQALQRLGAEVTQIEMRDRLLIREDEEVSEFAKTALEADGVRVLTSHK
ncbi:MAG: Mercuric reductase, partial [Pseudomonadota bacterium]